MMYVSNRQHRCLLNLLSGEVGEYPLLGPSSRCRVITSVLPLSQRCLRKVFSKTDAMVMSMSTMRSASPLLHSQRPRDTEVSLLQARVEAFEQAAADATDARILASRISDKSDRKKYDFASGLQHDVRDTRTALRRLCCTNGNRSCTFGELFEHTEGRIANLNRVLQNLKTANEVDFEPECFFMGTNDESLIELLEQFWKEEYTVDGDNVFRLGGESTVLIPEQDRRGRSYVGEDLQTRNVVECTVCSTRVKEKDRITIRASVYHLNCISCVVCGSSPRRKADYVTFNGEFCCSADCVRQYDGAHVRQERD